jgi:hypothetical protein
VLDGTGKVLVLAVEAAGWSAGLAIVRGRGNRVIFAEVSSPWIQIDLQQLSKCIIATSSAVTLRNRWRWT